MTKHPLEWGWDPSDTSNSSTAPDWKPATTLLGRHGDDVNVAAAGDLKCQGVCSDGGTWGTTGAYSIDGKILCRDCAVKARKIESLPGGKQNEILQGDELK